MQNTFAESSRATLNLIQGPGSSHPSRYEGGSRGGILRSLTGSVSPAFGSEWTQLKPVLTALALACGVLSPFTSGGPYTIALAIAAVALTLVSANRRIGPAAAIGTIVSLGLIGKLLSVWPRSWPLFLALPLAGYGVAAALIPILRSRRPWWTLGALDRRTIMWSALAVAGAAVALPLWAWSLGSPDIAYWGRALPDWPWPILGAGFLAFAVVNATVEEAVFRGVYLTHLEDVFGIRTAVLGQALAFGTMHLHGIPGGLSGMLLAGVYGILLGVIRHTSSGIGVPIVVHALADIVVVAVVVLYG